MEFERLPAAVANDAVRAVEDAIDAHLEPFGERYLSGEQGPAVVRALLDLGWTPPMRVDDETPLGDIADT